MTTKSRRLILISGIAAIMVLIGLVANVMRDRCFRYTYLNASANEYGRYCLERNDRLVKLRDSLSGFIDAYQRAPNTIDEWKASDLEVEDLLEPVSNSAGRFVILSAGFGSGSKAMLIAEPGYWHPCHRPNGLPQSIYVLYNDLSMDTISFDTWPPTQNASP